ncbi:MAG: hypothetical protein HN559_25485 [Gemmatimonadetes bacterium]|nr:hypothetical protein [Gemmatimonadota bacterium]
MKWLGLLVILALSLGTRPASAHHSGSVRAPILQGMVVDGELGDWPSSVEKYSFDRSDWDSQMRIQYAAQERPGAYFMTGYEPQAGILYLAIVVEDHNVIRGHSWSNTDGVEVYLSRFKNKQRNPTQYAMIPGSGGRGELSSGHGTRWRRTSSTKGDYTYRDGKLTYEWACRLGDSAPPLTAGEEIGFDVVILDQNKEGRHRWIPWGSPDVSKTGSNSRVGRLTLTTDSAGSVVAQGSSWMKSIVLWTLPLGAFVAVAAIGLRHFLPDPKRLEALERRLTDTQDVMIALSEKIDRIEAHIRPTDE